MLEAHCRDCVGIVMLAGGDEWRRDELEFCKIQPRAEQGIICLCRGRPPQSESWVLNPVTVAVHMFERSRAYSENIEFIRR